MMSVNVNPSARYCLTSVVVVRAGSWLYCEVEHLPVTIRVPGGAWRSQTLQVIPLGMRGLFGP